MRRQERGQALIWVLLLMGIVLALAASLPIGIGGALTTAGRLEKMAQAQGVAEAGLNQAIALAEWDPAWLQGSGLPSTPFGAGTYDVAVSALDGSPPAYQLTAHGTVGGLTVTVTVTATVHTTPVLQRPLSLGVLQVAGLAAPSLSCIQLGKGTIDGGNAYVDAATVIAAPGPDFSDGKLLYTGTLVQGGNCTKPGKKTEAANAVKQPLWQWWPNAWYASRADATVTAGTLGSLAPYAGQLVYAPGDLTLEAVKPAKSVDTHGRVTLVVNGNLTILSDVTAASGSQLLVLVYGDCLISSKASSINAFLACMGTVGGTDKQGGGKQGGGKQGGGNQGTPAGKFGITGGLAANGWDVKGDISITYDSVYQTMPAEGTPGATILLSNWGTQP